MGCTGDSKQMVENKDEPNEVKDSNESNNNNMQNQNENMENIDNDYGQKQLEENNHNIKNKVKCVKVMKTEKFKEENYPVFDVNWFKTSIQNFRLVGMGITCSGMVLYDKILITIDHSQNKAKFVKIYKKEREYREYYRKKNLIQKDYTNVTSLKDFESDLELIANDYAIKNLNDLYSKDPSTDIYIAAYNVDGRYQTHSYIFNKQNNHCIETDDEGVLFILDEDFDDIKSQESTKTPPEIIRDYQQKIKELVDVKKFDLKRIADETDIEINEFPDLEYSNLHAFWHKNFLQNFRLITRTVKEGGLIGINIINKIFITIDHIQNITKFIIIEIIQSENDSKFHLTQKMYREKCNFKTFQKEIEAYNNYFKVLTSDDIFAMPSHKDILIVANNYKGKIKRCAYIYDKNTFLCTIDSFEENYSSKATNKKKVKELNTEFEKKVYEYIEDDIRGDN